MKILFLIFLLPIKLCAQDVTGVWTGTLYNDTTKQFLRYELAISEYKGKLSGYSHTIFVIDSVENIGVKSIKIKKSGDDYLIEDEKLIYNNYPEPPAKGVKTYSDLMLSQNDSSMSLSGPWKTNTTKTYSSITGNILLKKKREIQQTLIIPRLQNLGLAKSLSFMIYDNYSKDVAITNTPTTSPQLTTKQEQNSEKSSLPVNTVPLKSTEEKEKGNDSKPIDANTKEIASTNKAILNTGSNKNEAENTSKRNSPIYNKTLDSIENKAKQSESDKVTGNNIVNNNDKESKKTARDNNQDLNTKAELNKNEIAVNKNKKEKELTQEQLPTGKRNLTKNNESEIEPKEVHQREIVEKNDQKLPAKTLVNNNETIKVDNTTPVSKAAADISSRKIETIQSVEIKSDSLLLTLYDNGEIDGDTVSVLLNGNVIMPRQGLTANGINKTIYITPGMGDSITLIMYAENLGSIPPNTGLLIVHDGGARHEIRFTGDLQKNSAIILRRKIKINK